MDLTLIDQSIRAAFGVPSFEWPLSCLYAYASWSATESCFGGKRNSNQDVPHFFRKVKLIYLSLSLRLLTFLMYALILSSASRMHMYGHNSDNPSVNRQQT